MNIENDGMRYPSIDQLATKTSSKYKLVIGDKVLVENPRSKKSIGMALEEVINDKVLIK